MTLKKASTSSRCRQEVHNYVASWILFSTILSIFVAAVLYGTVSFCKEKYQQSDPILHEIRENLTLLSPRVHELKFYADSKSYTLNKQKVYLCLKDEDDKYYPMNMLMYVAIHELAHVLCDEIGHTAKFQRIFAQLLSQASELGIYDPSVPVLRNYCGYNKETFVLIVNQDGKNNSW